MGRWHSGKEERVKSKKKKKREKETPRGEENLNVVGKPKRKNLKCKPILVVFLIR